MNRVLSLIRQHRHDLRDPDHDISALAPDPDASPDVEQIAIAADIDRIEAQAVVVRIREHYQAVQQLTARVNQSVLSPGRCGWIARPFGGSLGLRAWRSC